MGNTQVQNERGEWVPAIPLPFYGALQIGCPAHVGKTQRCPARWNHLPGGRARAERRYREHYALRHILGLD